MTGMRVDVVSIFPDYLAPRDLSLIGKARREGLLELTRDVVLDDPSEKASSKMSSRWMKVLWPVIWAGLGAVVLLLASTPATQDQTVIIPNLHRSRTSLSPSPSW